MHSLPIAYGANLSVPSARPVPSPCINVCKMQSQAIGEQAFCVACYRSLAEIAAWSTMLDADKFSVWQQLETRRALCESAPKDVA